MIAVEVEMLLLDAGMAVVRRAYMQVWLAGSMQFDNPCDDI
jgi:hypothetical protein